MFFHMVYKSGQIFLPFCHNPRVWRTDRQTDRQTEFSSLDRVCIACSAVDCACIACSDVAMKSCVEQLTISYILVTVTVQRLKMICLRVIIRWWDSAGIDTAFSYKLGPAHKPAALSVVLRWPKQNPLRMTCDCPVRTMAFVLQLGFRSNGLFSW